MTSLANLTLNHSRHKTGGGERIYSCTVTAMLQVLEFVKVYLKVTFLSTQGVLREKQESIIFRAKS